MKRFYFIIFLNVLGINNVAKSAEEPSTVCTQAGYTKKPTLSGWTQEDVMVGAADQLGLPVKFWLPEKDLHLPPKAAPCLWNKMHLQTRRRASEYTKADGKTVITTPNTVVISWSASSAATTGDDALQATFDAFNRNGIDFHFVIDCQGKIWMILPPYMQQDLLVVKSDQRTTIPAQTLRETTKAWAVGTRNSHVAMAVMFVNMAQDTSDRIINEGITSAQKDTFVSVMMWYQAIRGNDKLVYAHYSQMTEKVCRHPIPTIQMMETLANSGLPVLKDPEIPPALVEQTEGEWHEKKNAHVNRLLDVQH